MCECVHFNRMLFFRKNVLFKAILVSLYCFTTCYGLRTCDHNVKNKVYTKLYESINTTLCLYTTTSIMLDSIYIDSQLFNLSDVSRNVGVQVQLSEFSNETYWITFYIQNVTKTSFKSYALVVHDNITYITVEIQVMAHAFRMCNNNRQVVIIYTDVYESVNTTFCVLAPLSKIADFVLIKNDIYILNDTSRNVGVHVNKQKNILKYFFTFYIQNITETSFQTYDISIMDEEENILKQEVTISKNDFHIATDKNDLVANVQNSLICHINDGEILDIKLYKQYKGNCLMSTLNNTLKYTFRPLQCEDMGTYTCIVRLNREERKVTHRHLNIKYCPPVVCENQVTNQTYQVQLGATLSINYCIISPELNTNISINNQIYGLNQESNRNIQVITNTNQSQLYYNITIYLYHILPGDDQLYIVLFHTTTKRQLQQKFYISIQQDELRLCDNKDKHTIIFTKERQKLVLQTCIRVLLHNELHRVYVTLNGITFYHNKCINKKCVLWSRQSANTTMYTIYIVIENVTNSDFGALNVTVGTQYNYSKIISQIHYLYNIINNETYYQSNIDQLQLCNQTLCHSTEKSLSESSTMTSSNTSQLIIILTVIVSLILLLILLVVIGIKVKVKKCNQGENKRRDKYFRFLNGNNQLQSEQTTNMLSADLFPQVDGEYSNWTPSTQHNTSMVTGRYISQEGLVYVTIDHSQSNSRQKKKGKIRTQKESSVIYATLKF